MVEVIYENTYNIPGQNIGLSFHADEKISRCLGYAIDFN